MTFVCSTPATLTTSVRPAAREKMTFAGKLMPKSALRLATIVSGFASV